MGIMGEREKTGVSCGWRSVQRKWSRVGEFIGRFPQGQSSSGGDGPA